MLPVTRSLFCILILMMPVTPAAAASMSTKARLVHPAANGIFLVQAQKGDGLAQSSPAVSSRWSVRCDPAENGGPLRCRVLTNIRHKSTNQRIFTVLFTRPSDEAPLRLTLALPHGVYLPAGVQMQVDKGEGERLVIQTSDANGAYASMDLTDAQRARLTEGAVMSASFLSASRKSVRVEVALSGLGEALQAFDANR